MKLLHTMIRGDTNIENKFGEISTNVELFINACILNEFNFLDTFKNILKTL